MMSEDKRKAIEVVVADKAAAHDFEHADDDDDRHRRARPVSPNAPLLGLAGLLA